MGITRSEDLIGGTLSGRILDCALEVHRGLGPGLLESAYQACLQWELEQAGLAYRQEVEIPAIYKCIRLAGAYRADLIVEEAIIVEIKAVERLLPIHGAQLLTYLRLSGLRVGLLLNFNSLLLKHGTQRFVL